MRWIGFLLPLVGCVELLGDPFDIVVPGSGGAASATSSTSSTGGGGGAPGSLLWARSYGDNEEQVARDAAVDSEHNLVIVGRFSGTLDFGSPIASNGTDIFVVKIGPDGEHRFSKRFGDQTEQEAFAVAIDSTDSVIVGGRCQGNIDFGGSALAPGGGDDAFVVKLDVDGAHVWSNRYGAAMSQIVRAVSIRPQDFVAVFGDFEGSINPTGQNDFTSSGMRDLFVTRLSNDGDAGYTTAWGDPENQEARGIASDTAGNDYLTGMFTGTLDFGGSAITSAGMHDVFLARTDINGMTEAQAFGGAGNDGALRLRSSATGELALAGFHSGDIDFGDGAIEGGGGLDAFVAVFDPGAMHRFNKSLGDASEQRATGVAFGPGGNVFAAGEFSGAIELGTSAGASDIFLAAFAANGQSIAGATFGDVAAQREPLVVVDANGDVFVIGNFEGSIDFGDGPLESAGGSDIFVAKFRGPR